MASYNSVESIDDYLHQLIRLVGNGYIFFFQIELGPHKNPEATQQRLIDTWGLEIPYWKREKRRRGELPSIWLLRYRNHITMLSTYGRTEDGENDHPFFTENAERIENIRRTAMYFQGYSIRYPVSKATGKRKLFIRLDKDCYLNLKSRMCREGIMARYRDREAMEARFAALPYQPYEEVYKQMSIVLEEVNKRRKYLGYERLRKSCVPNRIKTPKVLTRGREIAQAA